MTESKEFHTGDLLPDALAFKRDDESVGKATYPFDFDATMVPLWDKEIAAANEALDRMGITVQTIDEIALLFPNEQAANTWIMAAVCDQDVHHFNGAHDRVKTSPIKSEYLVRYDFLSLRERRYRVEAMHITSGVSPLHASLRAERLFREVPVPVHLSFKCHDMETYERTLGRLEANGFTLAQACSSTYGVFSYWQHEDFDLYIKPRVNVRDGA